MANLGNFGTAKRDADPNYEPDTFEFYGESFEVARRVGGMPLLDFAEVATNGTEAEELEGLAAMKALLRDCLVPGDWARFQKVAQENKSELAEMMKICAVVYETVSARPTERPSDSADGPSTTGESSKAPSSG